MLRRFLLVGILVTVKQGSVEQIAYAALISMVYMALQIQVTSVDMHTYSGASLPLPRTGGPSASASRRRRWSTVATLGWR